MNLLVPAVGKCIKREGNCARYSKLFPTEPGRKILLYSDDSICAPAWMFTFLIWFLIVHQIAIFHFFNLHVQRKA
jgi:hypothetical protein